MKKVLFLLDTIKEIALVQRNNSHVQRNNSIEMRKINHIFFSLVALLEDDGKMMATNSKNQTILLFAHWNMIAKRKREKIIAI